MSVATLTLDPAWAGDVAVPGIPDTQEAQAGDQTGGSQWPRMLNLSEDVQDRIRQYLDTELMLCWSERSILVDDWIQWQKDYWAKPTQKVKNFPFKRAANVVIPITAIAVETIYAGVLTTIFSVKPFYSIRARRKPWIEAAPNVEQWFQTEIENVDAVDMDGFARESLLELIKLGTAVGKTGYERDVRKVNVDLPEGGSVAKWMTRKDGATLDYVPLANFYMRLFEKDPQTAAWVGEEHSDVTWVQIKRMASSGRMYPSAIESIKAYFATKNSESTGQKYDDARRKEEHLEPSWSDTLTFYEIWMSMDVDNDGYDEEIVLDYHKDSRTILSARYNWYEDAHRPYRIGVYIPVEGRWTGIGVGKQLEQFQALITTVHRQRLDAGTLANMGQLAIKKTSGYGNKEPIFPGKLWFVDNPATDIKEFSLSNTQHFAQIQNEEAAQMHADKRSGVNELTLGFPHQGTPATATTDLAKLAEGRRKSDAVLKNVRRWYGLLGLDLLANYQQFGAYNRSWLVRGEDGEWIEQFLQMPQTDVRHGVFLELTVTDSVTNKDVEQQKWTSLFAVLSGHYDKALERAIQVMQITQDPNLFLAFAEMSLNASNAAMTRLLGAYQVPDIDSFLLDINALKEKYAQLGAGNEGPAGPSPGGNGMAPPAGIPSLPTSTGIGGEHTLPGYGISLERI